MVSSTFLFLLALVHYSLADIDLEVYQEEDCPRNREQAAIGGRQCLRKCRSHADCISSRKQCLCDDLCGWSCVRPDLKCDYLEDIENGIIRRPEIEGFGAKVTYRCDEGFVMSGPRERRCQGDGSWSDKAPACRKKALCGTAPFVRHANHTSKTKLEFDIGFLLKYYCFVGYEAQGFSEAKCMFYNGTAQWFGPDLVCKPRSCGHPGFVEHADLEGDIFTYTRQVTFRCHPGYELFGRANIHCRENGMWSSALPTCRPVICPQPQDPKNGRAHYTAVTFQSVVKFQCRHGYRLDGNETLKCGANRTWEGEIPVCKEIDCPRLGVLHNGYLEGSTSTLGSVIYFRCFDGMKFEGVSRSTTCLKTGNWSHPLPKCLAPCIVPDVQNGRVNHFAPGSTIEHNQHLQVDCKPQHELVYNAMPATCRNGTWTHVPSCVAARCKHLPKQPKHGMVIAPKTDHNMTALYRCKDGYKLVGPNITVCNFGRWTTDTPRCEEVPCAIPKTEHGHYHYYQKVVKYGESVDHGEVVRLNCFPGFQLVGIESLRCWYGDWTASILPKCVAGPCELPTIPHGYYLSGYRAGLTISHGSSVSYDCKQDYVKADINPTHCKEGKLLPNPPACLTHTLRVKVPTWGKIVSSSLFKKHMK
ncbi:protein lev-9-like isoform X3 [Tachypleus tridentatus]|uniref:protein lev-9-like isoform X3 n=1 Tax=Tachypleus tridentatus TaxID=6853 RepID=UPI003FCFB9B1